VDLEMLKFNRDAIKLQNNLCGCFKVVCCRCKIYVI
jgi:hypothetical protein